MASSPFRRRVKQYQVRPHYADTDFYVLDMYTLEVSRRGYLHWVYHHAQRISLDKQYLQRRMYWLNRREGVPTLQGIKHGHRLTEKQFDRLCRHGLIASTKINRKENYYVIS